MDSETLISGIGQLRENLHPGLTLSGKHVVLKPMQMTHVEPLINAASDGQLWTLPYTSVPTPEQMQATVAGAIAKRDEGSEFPFVVCLAESDEIVGSTRYYYIEPSHRNLSIGFTWYAQKVQRSGVNTESKLLLLTHAFEVMNCISVQWHTDHRNKRSQAAIKRLGAKFEGVLRNHRIAADGVIRHTHCFSMLDTEWPQSKAYLQSRLDHYS